MSGQGQQAQDQADDPRRNEAHFDYPPGEGKCFPSGVHGVFTRDTDPKVVRGHFDYAVLDRVFAILKMEEVVSLEISEDNMTVFLDESVIYEVNVTPLRTLMTNLSEQLARPKPKAEAPASS